MQNLTIQGREFTVAAGMVPATGSRWYILTGPRGAQWITARYSNRPEVMRLVNFKGGELRIHGNLIELTDKSGELRAR